MLQILKNDPWLHPFQKTIEDRFAYIQAKEQQLTQNGKITLSDFANGYNYFGLQKKSDGWVLREWLPNATEVFLIGSFNNWQENPAFQFHRTTNNVWEVHIPLEQLHHGDHYKLLVKWEDGQGERIPAWCKRVVQDHVTHIFSAQVWDPPTPYVFKHPSFQPNTSPLLIYECHVGMATEEEKVGIYNEFRENILPRIKAQGYNAIQVMAIQEHPYYGSFGYQVSSFFAPSSRFGTPEELKQLIDTAHEMGIAVIMDIVHSHAVKNEKEGLGYIDGTRNLYFHSNPDRRYHPQWDSLCFDYGKNEVLHFLLSNCKYWLEEFKFDGFRFDGVTSMLYFNHGLEVTFTEYSDYYNGGQDEDAICYLTLANKLIHTIKPNAITIAEEVSGMPGLAMKPGDGGYGFDYRMAMNIPDFWIKLTKEQKDEDWSPSVIWWELTNRRADEKTISYAESHDQAMVGDKSLIFRLIDADMYWHMSTLEKSTLLVDRGLAIHKMIRLITATTINGGYLNFMGNEFGHPEWIDFPREGNNWSYNYARRLWSLADNSNLRFKGLEAFDAAMIHLAQNESLFSAPPHALVQDNMAKVLIFVRGNLLFVFNFHPQSSYVDYSFAVDAGRYSVCLDSDAVAFGGFARNDSNMEHFTIWQPPVNKLSLYLPARTVMVLKKNRNFVPV